MVNRNTHFFAAMTKASLFFHNCGNISRHRRSLGTFIRDYEPVSTLLRLKKKTWPITSPSTSAAQHRSTSTHLDSGLLIYIQEYCTGQVNRLCLKPLFADLNDHSVSSVTKNPQNKTMQWIINSLRFSTNKQKINIVSSDSFEMCSSHVAPLYRGFKIYLKIATLNRNLIKKRY